MMQKPDSRIITDQHVNFIQSRPRNHLRWQQQADFACDLTRRTCGVLHHLHWDGWAEHHLYRQPAFALTNKGAAGEVTDGKRALEAVPRLGL